MRLAHIIHIKFICTFNITSITVIRRISTALTRWFTRQAFSLSCVTICAKRTIFFTNSSIEKWIITILITSHAYNTICRRTCQTWWIARFTWIYIVIIISSWRTLIITLTIIKNCIICQFVTACTLAWLRWRLIP